MKSVSFERLVEELAHWQSLGMVSTWWWRDDDVCDPAPALDPLRNLSERHAVPVLMAAIPALVVPQLARETRDDATLSWCQHGYAHRDHSVVAGNKSEFPATRDLDECQRELREGWALLHDSFGERLLNVLVPPWNDLGDGVEQRLGSLGYAGLSRHGQFRRFVAGVARVDTHVDVVDWSSVPEPGDAWFDGLVARLVAMLASRRRRPMAADEPLGVLTHHRAMGRHGWKFMDALLQVLTRSPSVRWIAARDLFRL